jgi:hypothetical protein
MRSRYRVESICRVLTMLGCQVAPRTYRNWKKAPPSLRTITDAVVTDALLATQGTPEGLYGRRKWWPIYGGKIYPCPIVGLIV